MSSGALSPRNPDRAVPPGGGPRPVGSGGRVGRSSGAVAATVRAMGRTVPGDALGDALGLQDRLRAGGYRLTPQRQLVLRAVGELGHATPEELATAVRQVATGVNISTVYRTLELLEQLGLVRHTHLGHGAPTYSISTDDDHVHLVCRDCGAISEASPEVVTPVVEQLAASHGFHVDVGHFAVFGRCRRCAAELDGAHG